MDRQRSAAQIVALTLVAVVASAACVALGLWQGQRTLDIIEAERAAMSAPVPVLDAVSVDGHPGESIGRPVTAEGTYTEGKQALIASRAWQGRPGSWVVTPLQVGDQTVAVLRGWVDAPGSSATAVPTGTVVVSGVLQPFDEFYSEGTVLPDGQLAAISRPVLEQAWGTAVVSLVLVLQDQQPASSPAPEPVDPAVQTANVPFPIQNAAYTLQWFVFAVFVWLMWWLWLRRAPHEDAPAEAADSLET